MPRASRPLSTLALGLATRAYYSAPGTTPVMLTYSGPLRGNPNHSSDDAYDAPCRHWGNIALASWLVSRGFRSALRRISCRVIAMAVIAFGAACTPQESEPVVHCVDVPQSICEQLTPVVIDAATRARLNATEISISCDAPACTDTRGAYRTQAHLADQTVVELPAGQWDGG